MTPQKIAEFQKTVLDYYQQHGRHDLPWRLPEVDGSFDPYKIMVSEIMLQQTQVPRVIPKYQEFIGKFPTINKLADASLASVLTAWSGLGYNRRAKFLLHAAQAVMQEHGGVLPDTSTALITLPGIGINTAGAVQAYAYNKPVIFIETNIRTVFIHHFFANQELVSDKEIADAVELTLPHHGLGRAAGDLGFAQAPRDANPLRLYASHINQRVYHYRTWYWSIMDYGTHLKQTVGNLTARSKHYKKQSAFIGSHRQVRGQVLKLLGEGPLAMAAIRQHITDSRLDGVVSELIQEGLIAKQGRRYMLYGFID